MSGNAKIYTENDLLIHKAEAVRYERQQWEGVKDENIRLNAKVKRMEKVLAKFAKLEELMVKELQSSTGVSPKPVTKENSHVQDQNDQG